MDEGAQCTDPTTMSTRSKELLIMREGKIE
jgi:hypothetical protein